MKSEFVWPVRVYYEDTDAGGVVYYANYLKYMERARTEWLRAAGFEQDRLLAELGILFVVVEVSLRYHRPARFNDALEVTVVPVTAGRSRFEVAQSVRRDGVELVTGRVTAACIDAVSFKPRSTPPGILEMMK